MTGIGPYDPNGPGLTIDAGVDHPALPHLRGRIRGPAQRDERSQNAPVVTSQVLKNSNAHNSSTLSKTPALVEQKRIALAFVAPLPD
jgi:hypothetical protein